MGMDVYGKHAHSETGRYFRRSVWGWHPLADLCEFIAPELWAKIEHPHTNDGDGLNGRDSLKLAAALDAAVADGRVESYCKDRAEALALLPDETCSICAGTGLRLPAPQCGAGKLPCNGCGGGVVSGAPDYGKPGKGKIRPWETHYDVEPADVTEFAAFLRDCGGFEIR